MSAGKPQQRANPFLDVTPPGRRPPSWIAKHKSPTLDLRSLKPAPLPREFLDAVQAEVVLSAQRLDESAALQRGGRAPSEFPARASEVPRRESSHTPARTGAPSVHAPRRAAEPSAPLASVPPPPQPQLSPELRVAVEHALENLVHARNLVLETTAGQLAELAATIARRVIAHELSVSPETVRLLVDEGLAALERDERVLVRMGDGFASERAELFAHLNNQGGKVEVVIDPTLGHFGCVVETEHGWVDESIETRLAALLQELRSDSEPAAE